jgi:hypothetical protein
MNPTKSVWHFSELSTILYGFYKFLQKVNTIPEHIYTQAPRSLRCLQRTPGLRFGPQKELWLRNVVPGRRPPAVRPNSGEPPVERGRGRDLGSLGADSRARLGRGGAGEVGRRRPGAVAAAACYAGEVGVAPTTWGRLGARVGAKEGGGELAWVRSRPGPGLRRGCQQ